MYVCIYICIYTHINIQNLYSMCALIYANFKLKKSFYWNLKKYCITVTTFNIFKEWLQRITIENVKNYSKNLSKTSGHSIVGIGGKICLNVMEIMQKCSFLYAKLSF